MEPHEQTVWSQVAYRARTSRRKAGIVRSGSWKDPRTREVAGEFSDADRTRTAGFRLEKRTTRGTPTIKKLKQKRRSTAGRNHLAILSKHPDLDGCACNAI